VLADLGLDRASEAALIKLLAALPSVSRQGAEEIRQRIYVDTGGWRQSEDVVPCLPVVQDALWRDRRLRIIYGQGESPAERVCDPLGLVAKGSVWYLLAAVEGEIRTYRVSRIQRAEVLDEPCERPAKFDLARAWEESTTRFASHLPRYPAVVRVEASLVPEMRAVGRYARITREDPPDDEGWVRLEMVFEGEHNAREYVLSFGPRIEVIEPMELRETVIAAAEGILARYGVRANVTASETAGEK
jgi:predicted DNA-binding transcriptional regulator YafY